MILRMTFLIMLDVVSSRNKFLVRHDDCDFQNKAIIGNEFIFTNPYWPAPYIPNTKCKWIFDCHKIYTCRLVCDPLWLPASHKCSMDKLIVTMARGLGKRKFKKSFCGRDSIDVTSNARIVLELRSNSSSPGGRFRCSVRTGALLNAKYLM